ncbi:MAG: hypothetical protein K6B39_03900 [Lachnospiraceae bacterium]|nr:hypothetical protein [Lachnospiraceae bacterium]
MRFGKARGIGTITIIAAIIGAVVTAVLTATFTRLNDTNNRYATNAKSMSEVFVMFPAQQDKFISDQMLRKGEIKYCFEDVRDVASPYCYTTYDITVKNDDGKVLHTRSHVLKPGNYRGAYYLVTNAKNNMWYKISFEKKTSLDHRTDFDWLVLAE